MIQRHRSTLVSALAVLAIVGARPASAQSLDFAGGFTSASGLTLNGTTAVVGSQLFLTNPAGNASVFTTNPLHVSRFTTHFSFQIQSGTIPTADGFTFTIQRAGPFIVGGSGGSLGYTTVPRSVAVKFDLFDNAGEGNNSTGLFTNGQFPGVPAVDLTGSGIDLHSGHVFNVDMSYDGTTLSVTITDASTGASARQSYPINIPAILGGNAGYFGFTGATGGLTARQCILNWTLATPTAPHFRFVSQTGNNASTGLSWAAAKRTIQAALDVAASGDQIWVAAGVYSEHLVVPSGVELYGGFRGVNTETSLDNRNWTGNPTIIDGGGTGTGVFTQPGTVGAAVDGFTIRNSQLGVGVDAAPTLVINNTVVNNTNNWNCGIEGFDNSSPIVAYNYIANNTGFGDGGGMLFTNGRPVVVGNFVENNQGRFGGGANFFQCSDVLVEYNTYRNNRSVLFQGDGGIGGIIVSSNGLGAARFINNAIYNNTNAPNTGGAGGLQVGGTTSTEVSGNYIAGNTSADVGGVILGGAVPMSFRFNTIDGNIGGNQGGVLLFDSPSLDFSSNTVINNVATTGTGGLIIVNVAGTVAYNTFQGNQAGFAGGMQNAASATQILYNRFVNNTSTSESGGIEINGSSPLVANNLFTGNSALFGGAIGIGNAAPEILNNTIADNTATGNFGGINIFNSTPIIANNVVAFNTNGGIGTSSGSIPILHHNDVFGNTSFDYTADVIPGLGSLSADPLFVNRAAGDYHLQGVSPNVDGGDNGVVSVGETDLDLRPRILNGIVDLGAFEYPFARNVTSVVLIQRGGFTLDRATGRFVQLITLKNTGSAPIGGPISLALDNLTNATLFNRTGVTSATIPVGSSYANLSVSSLAPGQSATVVLMFDDPTRASISYTPRVLAGPSSR